MGGAAYFTNATEHPTAEWTAQQLLEAFPFDEAPRFLVRHGDAIYGEKVRRQLRAIMFIGRNPLELPNWMRFVGFITMAA